MAESDVKSVETLKVKPITESPERPERKSANVKLKLGAVLILLALCTVGLLTYEPFNQMNSPYLAILSCKQVVGTQADRVKDIALRNIRSYVIVNEKFGEIYVVEGQAVNNGPTSKDRIKVEVILYDEKRQVLTSKQRLGGNTLSKYQLQVETETEINDQLDTEIGILTSNTSLKTGQDTPFMIVFFKHTGQAKNFDVKVVDALNTL